MPAPVNLAQAVPVDGWLARLGRGLWAPRCLVCREPAVDRFDLCARCEAALPWMPPACLSCAMPLPPAAARTAAPAGTAPTVLGRMATAAPTFPRATVTAAPTIPAGSPCPSPPRLCSACQHAPPPLTQTHATFLYGFPLDRLLPRLKFHRDLAAGRLLAQAMAASLSRHALPDALVPVPLHRSRLRERGFNQALELARPLGRMLGVPVRGDFLLRTRKTAPQSRLDAEARAGNLRDAFETGVRATPPPHVVLVDDVMTTGATLHAAADALFDVGVERVDAWICARAP
ncbi:ComF family protein [Luteimonas sp. MJ246]|uniref:ComF family protein n=1 Tax=Luteimonas sp. MJ174 TaxID=3129237 RepID=UPI0031BBC4F9